MQCINNKVVCCEYVRPNYEEASFTPHFTRSVTTFYNILRSMKTKAANECRTCMYVRACLTFRLELAAVCAQRYVQQQLGGAYNKQQGRQEGEHLNWPEVKAGRQKNTCV